MPQYGTHSSITHALHARYVQGNFATESGRISSGEDLEAGSVLGEKKLDTIGQAFSGTGNGTMTGLNFDVDTKVGDYKIKCVEAIADGGRFSVVDPDGDRLDDAVVGTAYDNSALDFTINDGATDFVVDDEFTVTVAAPAQKEYKLSVATAKDGSAKPIRILDDAVDASAGAVDDVLMYKSGHFSDLDLVFGAGVNRNSFDENSNIIVNEGRE